MLRWEESPGKDYMSNYGASVNDGPNTAVRPNSTIS